MTLAINKSGLATTVVSSPSAEGQLFFGSKVSIQPRKARNVVFTSCNWSYMDKALALAESVKKFCPAAEFHILLVDSLAGDQHPSLPNVDRIFPASNLEDFSESWVFKHNLVELCTAVKPLYALVLLDEGYEQIIFADPDTFFLATPRSISVDLLRADVLLTPHLHRPAASKLAIDSFEVSALAHGIFNLGFFAVKNSHTARDVMSYWADRCRDYCYGEVHRGLFTDQKWMNHVPVYFDRIAVSRYFGLNAAVWNMEGRRLSFTAGEFYVDEQPLELFHFSGWDVGVPGRFASEVLSGDAGDELLRQYADETEKFVEFRRNSWVYASFSNGDKILDAYRICYRRNADLQAAFANPFQIGERTYHDWLAYKGLAEISAEYDESLSVKRVY